MDRANRLMDQVLEMWKPELQEIMQQAKDKLTAMAVAQPESIAEVLANQLEIASSLASDIASRLSMITCMVIAAELDALEGSSE